MALSSHALTTVAAVRDELDISDNSEDTRLERLINEASEAIESYCGRHFEKGTVTEVLPAKGTHRLILSRVPVLSITSITPKNGTALDSSEYVLENAAAGFVYRLAGWSYSGVVARSIAGHDRLYGTEEPYWTVVYEGGYVLPKDDAPGNERTLPWDLERAAIETVVSLYRGKGQDKRVQSEKLMSASVTYFAPGEAGVLPPSVLAILDRYRLY